MEILDVVDENGEPTGELVERTYAHEHGVRHRTSHVWIFRVRDGRLEVLLQERSDDKDSYPGCYDISSAGHIPASSDYIPLALRELYEEMGMQATEEELVFAGARHIHFEAEFYGKPFIDEQVTHVFVMFRDTDAGDINFQREEIKSVKWMDFQSLREAVHNNTIKHCIVEEELDMLIKPATAIF